MAHVKIHNDTKEIVGTIIEIDGKSISDVTDIEVSIGVDHISTVSLTQFVEPNIEIEADVDITKICRCCGQRITN